MAAAIAPAAEKTPPSQLLEMARKEPNAPQFREAAIATLGDADIKKGAAIIGEGPDFLWLVESESKPELLVDDEPRPPMKSIKGTKLWMEIGQLRTGTSHKFVYKIDGKITGGKTDVAAFGPDSYEHPGVPQGKISEKFVHTSKMYEGMKTDYWIYVPAQYDPKVPAALMVWHDGQGLVERNNSRVQNVIDNLTFQKKVPVTIHVFISPGKIGDQAMRSILYDTVTDKHARFWEEELLPEVEAKYNIRKDGYSRACAGNSSGGISSFNIAWWHPEWFSRVLSRIGSFTSIQWHPGELDGGNVFPFMVRKQPKRNIRVWLQDGSEDLENNHGSWPLQNIQMANSLKMREYDFHLSFGNNTHNGAMGNAEAPEELTWVWRDYDPSKTDQIYEMDPGEKDKPYFRVRIYNR